MEEKITSLNIQPQAGVLGVFSRLNYKPWYAIAEFVDNSTQSFYNNEKTLVANGIKTVTVRVEYDFENNVLKITDDAFGMEMDDFARAVKVDSPPESKDGRNEFGMGLKTAASWFGNTWSVESTQFGSSNKYYTEVNIQELREKHLNTIDIIETTCKTTCQLQVLLLVFTNRDFSCFVNKNINCHQRRICQQSCIYVFGLFTNFIFE